MANAWILEGEKTIMKEGILGEKIKGKGKRKGTVNIYLMFIKSRNSLKGILSGILTTTLWDKDSYNLHFTNEGSETQS